MSYLDGVLLKLTLRTAFISNHRKKKLRLCYCIKKIEYQIDEKGEGSFIFFE